MFPDRPTDEPTSQPRIDSPENAPQTCPNLFSEYGPAYFSPWTSPLICQFFTKCGGTILDIPPPISLWINQSLFHIQNRTSSTSHQTGESLFISSFLDHLSSAASFFALPNDPFCALLHRYRPLVVFYDAKWVEKCFEAGATIPMAPYVMEPGSEPEVMIDRSAARNISNRRKRRRRRRGSVGAGHIIETIKAIPEPAQVSIDQSPENLQLADDPLPLLTTCQLEPQGKRLRLSSPSDEVNIDRSKSKKPDIPNEPRVQLRSPIQLHPNLATRPMIFVDHHSPTVLAQSQGQNQAVLCSRIGITALQQSTSDHDRPESSQTSQSTISRLASKGSKFNSHRQPFSRIDPNRSGIKASANSHLTQAKDSDPSGDSTKGRDEDSSASEWAEFHTRAKKDHAEIVLGFIVAGQREQTINTHPIPIITVESPRTTTRASPPSPGVQDTPIQVSNRQVQRLPSPLPSTIYPPRSLHPITHKHPFHSGYRAPAVPIQVKCKTQTGSNGNTIPRFEMDDVLSMIERLHGQVGDIELVEPGVHGRWEHAEVIGDARTWGTTQD